MKPILVGAMLLHLACLSLAAPEVLYGQEDVPKYYYGALKDDNEERVPLKEHNATNDIIPRFFDARWKWPYCPSIWEIRNQGPCQSCWAVAAAATMTDRLCIFSNGSHQFQFSSEHIVTCCPKERCCGEPGCCESGGLQLAAWEMLMETGVVSGGEYGSHTGCQPYEIPPRTGPNLPTPRCQDRCESGYYTSYNEDLHYGDGLYRLKGERNMQLEIMLNGPIQAAFDVYEDFHSWDQKGVYVHTGGKKSGGHSVKVIGWGEEKDGTPFWIVANSWGRQWGERGFFKFLRGSNQCFFEEQAVAGIPRV